MKRELLKGDAIQRQKPFHSSNEENTVPSADDLLRAVEALDEGVLFLDRACTVTYANNQAQRLLNAGEGALIGQVLHDTVPAGFGCLLRERVVPALEGLAGDGFEAWCPDPAGRRLHCRCLPSSGGVTVILADITHPDQERGTENRRDIATDRAHEPPAASRDRYQALFESMPQGVVEYDANGRLLDMNRSARESLGMDAGRMRGRSIREFFSSVPEVRREDGTSLDVDSLPALTALATGREVRNTIARVILPGRQACRWVRHDAIPWFGSSGGKPGGVFEIITDITEMKNIQDALSVVNEDLERIVREQTEEHRQSIRALEKQKETFQTIFDSIPAMLVFHDSSRRLTMVNRAFERLTGWSLADRGAEGLFAATFPDPELRGEAWAFALRASGAWHDFEVTTRSGDALASSWLCVRLSDGSLIAVGVDLRLCRLCLQIGNDLAKFAAALEQTEEGVAIIGLDETVEFINPAFETMTGYQRHEVVGRKLSSMVDYFADGRRDEIHNMVASLQRPWSGCQKRRRKNGEVFDASISVTPIRDDAGRVMNYVSVTRDVTRENAMQQQLEHARKMEALGTLAGGIAHDLRNIFTPILMDTETLMQDMGVQHPFYPVLDEIHKATTLGIDLVKQMHTFGQGVPREKAPLDLYPVVRRFLSFLRSAMSAKVDISHHLCPNGAVVMADATQIQQVLMNLGINARHAMRKKGGILTVELAAVDLDEQAAADVRPDLPPGPYVEITMKDTGEGMDAQVADRIFEPFFTTKKPGEGSGMGLSVVHGIVKDHGGAISVWTRPGQGSSFRVLLPRLPGEISPGGSSRKRR